MSAFLRTDELLHTTGVLEAVGVGVGVGVGSGNRVYPVCTYVCRNLQAIHKNPR